LFWDRRIWELYNSEAMGKEEILREKLIERKLDLELYSKFTQINVRKTG
jgi:hypothetical protein